jgi:diacylglycerol kinase
MDTSRGISSRHRRRSDVAHQPFWLILSIGLVWAAEAGNTAIEQLCNLVHQARHPTVKRVKDVAAGAVLLCAIAAAAIGAMTLGPYFSAGSEAPFPSCGEFIQ